MAPGSRLNISSTLRGHPRPNCSLVTDPSSCEDDGVKQEQKLFAVRAELSSPATDYHAAKEQSRRIDASLGYRCEAIEGELSEEHRAPSDEGRQFWYGLDLQSLQTPYAEIVAMIRHLVPADGDTWVDLGAAYGRIGIVLGLLCPAVRFRAFEYVRERAEEAERVFRAWNFVNAQSEAVDLADESFGLPRAEVYFIYDFGSREDVAKVLEKLRVVAQTKSIRVIARGRGIRHWISTTAPWLAEVNEPEHFAHWSLYRS